MKMEFSKLENIALEGGGGKGAVYKGAIIALERLFDAEWRRGAFLKNVAGALNKPDPIFDPLPSGEDQGNDGTSILDYFVKEGELKIKGISGASAGAITAFPLALGLTSEDIDTILSSYRFKREFLPNHQLNEGRYRMVGMDEKGHARILVGEDQFRKLGEYKVKAYEISLAKKVSKLGVDKSDTVGSNAGKSLVRSLIVSLGFSVIFTGLKDQWPIVNRIAQVVGDFLEDYNVLKKGSSWLKSNIVQRVWELIFKNPRLVRMATSFTPVPLNALLKALMQTSWLKINRLPWGSKNQLKIMGLLPTDNVVAAVGNVLWDRGIYAGFEIRELFFKILMLAISKDTHFSRELQQSERLLREIGVTKKEVKEFTVTFDNEFEMDPGEFKGTLTRLTKLQEELTFKELHDITKINLVICVTNATTNQPVYFSHFFTPDFPVLDAVGASMSFPVAFKPLYNEANVLLVQEGQDDDKGATSAKRILLNPSDFVKFQRHGRGVQIYKEHFSMRNYNKHLGILLRYVKEHSPLGISPNGNLSFRSFLPYLREIIANKNFESFEIKDHEHNRYETFDSSYVKALCYFYYNSAFKGLLIDGGATNNLPSSIFTIHDQPADTKDIQDLSIKAGTLSLKLDNTFPEALRSAAFDLLDKDPKALAGLTDWSNEAAHNNFAQRIFKARKFRKGLQKNQSLPKLSQQVWAKLSRELVAEYKKTVAGFTPWNKEVNIFAGLILSLQFGADQGQIESLDDNENIIPLYCYGLDTFDFDLTSDETQPLVKMAVDEAEVAVREYFGK